MQTVERTPLQPHSTARTSPGVAVPEQLQFLATAGFAVVIVLVLAMLREASPHPASDHPLHTLEWLAVALFVPAFTLLEWLSTRAANSKVFEVWNASRAFCAAAYIVVACVFMYLDSGAILLIIALAQALVVYVLSREFKRNTAWLLWTYGASLGAWIFSANISYTPLEKLMLNASPATALIVPVLAASVCLLIFDLAQPFMQKPERFNVTAAARYLIAALFFLELGFRTDATLADWIPYHQMYWVGPATFVRDGHYLLWDVPSQYGFLSELVLAFFPANSVWQSLYELTAIVLTVQALLLFVLLVVRRSGLLNVLVSLLVCSAIFFSSEASRYPFGPRLYPQGGLRFIWVIALMFIAYKVYAAANQRSASLWRIGGWLCWGIATLWAFESLAWCTFIWGGFIATEYAVWVLRDRPSWTAALVRAIGAFAPFVLIAVLAFGGVDAFYRIRLGHGPDWTGYLEFSALYAADSRYHVVTETFGPGWLIVLLLGALAVPAVYALRWRSYSALPILAANWLAVWACASYYVGEPYDNHVGAITTVLGFSYAIVSLVMADLGIATLSFTRLAFVPLFAILITTSYGEPSRIADVRAPFMPGYQFNAVDRMPAVSGELAEIVRRAGIRPGDRVVFPNSPAWVKFDGGLISPFMKRPDGKKIELIGWIPESPAGPTNTMNSLPIERRLIYIERFLQTSPQGGWYITYRSDARCPQLAPGAVNAGPVIHTFNYAAVKCAIAPSSIPFIVRKVTEQK